jgi:hypothetical protein
MFLGYANAMTGMVWQGEANHVRCISVFKTIGGKYNFTTEDEILVPEEIGDNNMEELIVAREGK